MTRNRTAKFYQAQAKRLLLKGETNSRAFDDCFEDGFGDEVVFYLMQQATRSLPAMPQSFPSIHSERQAYNRLLDAHQERNQLATTIKHAGFWQSWHRFLTQAPADFQLIVPNPLHSGEMP